MRATHLLVLPVLLSLAACGPGPDADSGSEEDPDAAPVRDLVDRQVSAYLATDPELATFYGVEPAEAGGPYAHRLVDYRPEAERERRALIAGFVEELDALAGEELSRDDRLTVAVARSVYGSMAASREISYGRQYPFWYYGHTPYVVNQISGPHIDVPNLMANQQEVSNGDEADAYLARLAAIGPQFDGVIARMEDDASRGASPPRVLLARTLEVLDDVLETPAAESDLVVTLEPKLEDGDFTAAERERVMDRATAVVDSAVLPAYRRLRETAARLAGEARTEAGVWALPDGEAFYRASVRAQAGVDLSPDSIHAIGLAEVARIEGELEELLDAGGMTGGTVGERLAALGEESRFLYPDTDEGREQLLRDLRAQVSEVQALAPEYFATIPPQEVVVRRVPEFSQATAPSGYYDPPSLDGSRPGVYYVNLRDMEALPRWTLPTLTYHEAVPGHHHQIATALASGGDRPLVRRLAGLNPYTEGWALYAEQLAWEMGLYEDDPWGDVGRLKDELWRAVRLVVDTGIHWKQWSRERAIEYMASTTGTHPTEVRAEIERYMAWPAQALGYKMGMLTILRLREEAREARGEDFDIRRFHDRVLRNGALPLEVLEERVRTWTEAGE